MIKESRKMIYRFNDLKKIDLLTMNVMLTGLNYNSLTLINVLLSGWARYRSILFSRL